MRRIRSRITYANVVATLALFLVLSGGTAVALQGSNTVFSDDIVDNQVRSADVHDYSLTGADVKESSLGRVPQAGNADTLDGQDSTHFGAGIMGGVMKDVGISAPLLQASSGRRSERAPRPRRAPSSRPGRFRCPRP